MSRPSKLSLILTDDHPVLREGLSLILGTLPDMAVDMAFTKIEKIRPGNTPNCTQIYLGPEYVGLVVG
jgi:hypothetical protein